VKLKARFLAGLVLAVSTAVCSAGPALAYNGSQAASYADSWWNGRNGAYPAFADDCTNFVSQSLFAGGQPPVGTPGDYSEITNDYYWWWDPYVSLNTHSWSVAINLYSFLGLSGDGYVAATSGAMATSGTDSLSQGDVLFYDWQGNGISHSTIQTVNYGVDPTYGGVGSLVDQHSNDRYHMIWTLQPKNPYAQTTTIYEVHVTA